MSNAPGAGDEFVTPDGVHLPWRENSHAPGARYLSTVSYRGRELEYDDDEHGARDDDGRAWTVTGEFARYPADNLAVEDRLAAIAQRESLDVSFYSDPDSLCVYCRTLELAKHMLDLALADMAAAG